MELLKIYSEIVKGKPLTQEETKLLLDLIESSNIIITKTTNATNNKLKNDEWIRLSERFNASANCPRTPQQLRLKWENLKKNARKRCTKIRMSLLKTGGGPVEYFPPDETLDRVTGLLGSTANGFTVLFGGDREIQLTGGSSNSDGGDGGIDNNVGDARVSMVENDIFSIPLSNNNDIENVVPNCQVLDQNLLTPVTTKRVTFTTPRIAKKIINKKIIIIRLNNDESRKNRNNAIAEFYLAKKQCLDHKLENINLENEHLKLQIIQMKIKNDNLNLETEKLKFEIDKLKKEQ